MYIMYRLVIGMRSMRYDGMQWNDIILNRPCIYTHNMTVHVN